MAKRYIKPRKFGPLRLTFIRDWRESAGLSEEDMAELMETSKSTVWRIETGRQGYSQDFLEAAAAILRCEPWDLLKHLPDRVDMEWRQEWDEIRGELRGTEKLQALQHLRAILYARKGR